MYTYRSIWLIYLLTGATVTATIEIEGTRFENSLENSQWRQVKQIHWTLLLVFDNIWQLPPWPQPIICQSINLVKTWRHTWMMTSPVTTVNCRLKSPNYGLTIEIVYFVTHPVCIRWQRCWSCCGVYPKLDWAEWGEGGVIGQSR